MWACRYLGPLVAWIALILFVATRTSAALLSPRITTALGISRELLQYPYHLGVFCILAMLFARCVRALGVRERRVIAIAVLGTVIVSITSELLQFWTPPRTPSARDLLLDFIGNALGIALMRHLASPAQTT